MMLPHLRRCFVVMAAVAGLALPWSGHAQAQTVLVKQDVLTLTARDAGGQRTCLMTLVPSAPIDAEEPQLIFATEPWREGQPRATVLELGVAKLGEGAEAIQLLSDDARQDIGISNPFDLSAQTRPLALDAFLAGRPVHLTGRLPDGTYRSAMFEAPGFPQAFAIMHRECGIETGTLAAMSDLFAEEEKALGLGGQDLRKLVWTLHSKYEDTAAPPSMDDALSTETRNLVLRYSEEKGLAPSRYLTEQIVARLNRENFKPKRIAFSARDFKRSRDWYTFSEIVGDNRRCVLGTEAKTLRGGMVWRYPHLQFAAVQRTPRRGLLTFDLLTPRVVVLEGSRSIAQVDGRRFTLAVDETTDTVVPTAAIGSPFTDFIRSVQNGRSVIMRGPHADSDGSLVIEFSALGFTAGFRRLIEICGRGDLKAWLK